jgi:hypothetical protein
LGKIGKEATIKGKLRLLAFLKLNLNADILFVLTDENEFNIFENLETKKCFIPFQFRRGADYRGIITIKKLLGVEVAINMGYEYAIVIDCETVFTKNFDSYGASKFLSDRKKVFSTKTKHHFLIEINRRNADFFSEDERNKLKLLTNDFTEYFWFNDICFYDLDVCKRFFTKVYGESKENFYAKMMSAHFDHVIYIFYCLLYENYKIENANDTMNIPHSPSENFHLGFLESIGDRSTRNLINEEVAINFIKNINPFWIPYGTNLKSDNCFMSFHSDRA